MPVSAKTVRHIVHLPMEAKEVMLARSAVKPSPKVPRPKVDGLPQPSPEDIPMGWVERAVRTGETVSDVSDTVAGVAVGAGKLPMLARFAPPSLGSVGAGAARVSGPLMATLTAVDATRMVASPTYRKEVGSSGANMADRLDRRETGLPGSILEMADYVYSRPAAAGPKFWAAADRIDTARVNALLRAESRERLARDINRRYKNQLAAEQMRRLGGGMMQPNLSR